MLDFIYHTCSDINTPSSLIRLDDAYGLSTDGSLVRVI